MSEQKYSLVQDAWLEGHLGVSCYKLSLQDKASGDDLRDSLAALPAQAFCYARVPTQDTAQSLLLQEQNFRVIDCSVQFERPKSHAEHKPEHFTIRYAQPQDEAAVREIAKTSFQYSRFHLDTRIPSARAHALKADWAGNYYHGKRGDAMIVAEQGGTLLGFLQIFVRGPELCIDLIGVSKEAQGLGIGTKMIAFAEAHTPHIVHLVVGTQAANTQSLRFYEKNGSRVQSSYYVLHLVKGNIA